MDILLARLQLLQKELGDSRNENILLGFDVTKLTEVRSQMAVKVNVLQQQQQGYLEREQEYQDTDQQWTTSEIKYQQQIQNLASQLRVAAQKEAQVEVKLATKNT